MSVTDVALALTGPAAWIGNFVFLLSAFLLFEAQLRLETGKIWFLFGIAFSFLLLLFPFRLFSFGVFPFSVGSFFPFPKSPVSNALSSCSALCAETAWEKNTERAEDDQKIRRSKRKEQDKGGMC